MAEIALEPLPPAEAIDWFRGKGYAVGFDWRDVWQEEHQVAFTAAKSMSLDILSDIRGAVDQAIADGISFEQFQKQLTPVLQAKGWWGRRTMTDPKTGREVQAQLGSRRRLEIIYDTNLRTAHAAGRWQRIERTRDLLPWLQYHQIDRPTKRPAHVPFDGLVLPIDDPFWNTHYPPNGWKCKCSVHQYSDGQLDRLGLTPSPSPTVDLVPWLNRRTGETLQVPRGIDPGFDQNVGKIDRRAAALERLQQKRAMLQLPAAAPPPPTPPSPAPSVPPAEPDLQQRWDAARAEVLREGRRTGAEHLRCYTETGEDLGITSAGKAAQVGFSPRQLAAIRTPGSRVVAHHNHPRGTALSGADIGCLDAYPGLVEVVAHGHQGSWYAARRIEGADAPAPGLLPALHDRAKDSVRQQLLALIDWRGGPLSPAEAEMLHAHLVLLALHEVSVVYYRYDLQGDIAALIARQADVVQGIVRQAEDELRKAPWTIGWIGF